MQRPGRHQQPTESIGTGAQGGQHRATQTTELVGGGDEEIGAQPTCQLGHLIGGAQVDQARAAIGQAEANIDELNVTAPQGGQVTGRMVELGENVGAGAPLFTIVDLDRTWFTFNIRENLLGGLKVGDRLRVQVPALDAQVDATVTLINAQGDFASWRATRATGDFDLRSFEVRAAPATPVPGLRPGMSALIRPAEAEGE